MIEHLYINAIVLVSVICAISGISHLVQLPQGPSRRAHWLYSILALMTALQTLALALSFLSENPSNNLLALRCNLAFVLLTKAALLWFFAEYSQVKLRPVTILFSGLIALLFILNLTQPATLQFSEIHELQFQTLPWGERLAHFHGVPSAWFNLAVVDAVAIVLFAIGSLVAAYRRDRRPAFIIMASALGFLLVSYLTGSLFRMGIIHSPPISPICFLAVITVMGYELRKDLRSEKTGSGESRIGGTLLLIFFLLVLGSSAISWFVLAKSQQSLRADAESQLSAVADLKVTELELWYQERFGDGLIFEKNRTISALVKRVVENPADQEARKDLRMWFGKYLGAYDQYDQACLFDTKGAALVCMDPSMAPVDPAVAKNIPSVLRKGRVSFQDFYRGAGDGKIHLGILVPIYDTGVARPPLGLIYLRINPYAYLYDYIKKWPLPSKTAETILFRRDGNDVLFLNELRFAKDSALKLRFPLTQIELPPVQVILGREGVLRGTSYQGKQVTAVARKVPNLPWALIAKTDNDEIEDPMKEKTFQVILLVLSLLFSAGIGCWFIWREQQNRYNKQKAESDAKYRQIFDNIQDVFIQVDAQGVIQEISPSIERFIGYRREELLGKKMVDLYWNPADRPLFLKAFEEHGEVTDFEVRFRDRSGGSIYGSVNARLVRNAEGKTIGIEGSLRDITERVKARENQRFLAYILEQTADGVVMADLELKIIGWNKGAETIFGYQAEEMLGKSGKILNTGDDRDNVENKREALNESGGTLRYETVRKGKNGRLINLDVSSTTLKDESGHIIGYSAIYRDITERVKAQESLRLLANILEQTPDAVVSTDMEEKIIVWNQGAEIMFGFKAAEVLGKSLNLLVPEHLMEESLRGRQSFKGGQETQLYRTTRKKKDGTLLQVDVKGGPLRDSEGKIIGISLIYRDVSEQLKAQETQRLLASILEQTPDGVILSDMDNITRQWNKGAERIFGYTAEEILGKPGSVTEPTNRSGEIANTSGKLMEGQDSINYETVRKHKDGRLIDVAVTRFRLKDEQGKPVGFAAIVRDITERKRVESELENYQTHLEEMVETRTLELEKARKAAETATQAKSSFLANMSHEIRTPMNAILGFAQLMRRDSTITSSQSQQVDVILRSGNHLLGLINDILDYSKVEADRLPVEESNFDLHTLLKDLNEMFQVKARSKGLRLLVENHDLLPRYVVTDETKLRQILQNLLSNAMKFTTKGGVAMRVAVKPKADGAGDHLLVEVEDSGPGIAPEEMGKLFQVFEQTESGRMSKSGTGLGLAISRKFAELLGGTLEAESHLGQGSVFRLEIPIREGIEIENAPKPHRVVGLEPGQPAWKVLVVDDNPDNRGYLESLLSMVGFEVRTTVDGAEGVREFIAYKPHLILMDLRMPVMEGPEAIRRIRESEGGDKVKIIAVSASTFKEDQKKAIKVGADDFLGKPFREETLFEKMSTLLGARFVFAADQGSSTPIPPNQPMEALTKERVAALPAELRQRLRNALLIADLDAVLAILIQIEKEDAQVAASLRALAGKFNYQQILDLLQT